MPTFTDMKLTILHETKTWLAVVKPSGVVVEASPYEPSLETAVRDYLAQSYRNPFVGVIHRLDRVTSGLVLFAKRKSSLRYYNQLFAERQIQKTYLALVDQVPAPPQAKLTHWLARDASGKKAVVVAEQPSAKKAILSYQVADTFGEKTLLEVKPETGRFHQIRVQLASIGCPIVGDEGYGGTPWAEPGIGLHAWRLRFVPHQEEAEIRLEVTWDKTL